MRMLLTESARERTRKPGGTAASVALHVAMVAAAVVATQRGASATERCEFRCRAPDVLVYSEPERTLSPRPAPGGAPTRRSPRTDVGAPPTVDASPVDVATVLPGEGPIATVPFTFSGDSSVVHSSGRGTAGGTAGSTAAGAGPLSDVEVDSVVRPLGRLASPRYPETLRVRAVTGHVVVEFIVDTLGRVEPGSARIAEATDSLFARSARDAVARYRFAPAVAAGHHVRQLVRLPFTFTLDR